MRNKFSSFGGDIFATHEILEMLLFQVIPCRDTNEIARRLVLKFKTLENIFCAGPDELMTIDGVGEAVALFIKDLAAFLIDRPEEDNRIYAPTNITFDASTDLSTEEKAGKYFIDLFGECEKYTIAFSVLDSEMQLKRSQIIFDCDLSSARVRTGAVRDLLTEGEDEIVICAHYHPYGPLFPTLGDVATLRMLSDDLYEDGVKLIDHFVICGDMYLSTRNMYPQNSITSPAIQKYYESRGKRSHG